MTNEAIAALDRIALFDGIERTTITSERLGGLTNRNYKIGCPAGNFVLRLSGEGTEEYIDRKVEEHNAKVAADAGVNAEVVFFDASDGTMVSRYVEGSVTLDAAGFKDLGAVARAGVAFKRLHDCKTPFETRFDLFEKIDEYLALVAKMGAPVPDGYAEVQAEAEAVRAALESHNLPLAPCHCDPLAENFLDTGERIFIIDYEYGGNNDPMWDLGDLSVEAAFDDHQERIMLEAYFGGQPPAFEVGRMVMYKAMCDLLWTLWGVIQVANKNPVDDFEAYVTTRLNRCRVLMATEDFPRHLEAVRKGWG